MKIEQATWTASKGWEPVQPGALSSPQLVLVFGGTSLLKDRDRMNEVLGLYPDATVVGCSTSGEIYDTRVSDGTLSLTAVHFEHTTVSSHSVTIPAMSDSQRMGQELAASLATEGLVHVFVLCDGLQVNGSDLVRGLSDHLPDTVTVTGGLAGDGSRFQETYVFCNEQPVRNRITALAFYGDRLQVRCSSLGGWDPFGPERLITRSESNILYELDNRSALDLYKQYLGDHAKDLPASGLLFPLALKTSSKSRPVVRTILAVDEENNSITFAGDMPAGARVRLMRANFDRLVDGAIGAAQACQAEHTELAILISCVGRKLVLKQRIEEEVEGVRDIFGEATRLTGFYSYGEISPFTPGARCELHNQTMTITAMTEK